MTSKVYRSAQGKMVDLGTIMLQNEHVRAVGNMKVNARGDKIDNTNQVFETKPQQIQRQNNATTTNVSSSPVHSSSKKARAARQQVEDTPTPVAEETPEPIQEVAPAPVAEETPTPIPAPAPVAEETPTPIPAPAPVAEDPIAVAVPPAPGKMLEGGVTAALARQRETNKAQAPKSNNKSDEGGGLASALARSREIKQELERTRRQQAQDKGLRKI
jgi:hypothetical protein